MLVNVAKQMILRHQGFNADKFDLMGFEMIRRLGR
jgi:hypothetical protein